jgi:hypothetical protein
VVIKILAFLYIQMHQIIAPTALLQEILQSFSLPKPTEETNKNLLLEVTQDLLPIQTIFATYPKF